MLGLRAENAAANGPASRTRSKSGGPAPAVGPAQAAKPAVASQRPGGRAAPAPTQQQQPQPTPRARELVSAALSSPPSAAQQGAVPAAGAQQERRLQEEACVGQLRALLGSYDQLPPGDHKFLVVMRKVAAIWAPGQWTIDTVEDAHEVLMKLLARFEQDKLAPWEGTPVARRAMLRYVQSAMA